MFIKNFNILVKTSSISICITLLYLVSLYYVCFDNWRSGKIAEYKEDISLSTEDFFDILANLSAAFTIHHMIIN